MNYTLTFDVVLPPQPDPNAGYTEFPAVLIVGSSSSLILMNDLFSSGPYTFNFTGNGTVAYVAFGAVPNQQYQFDNIKLVAHNAYIVTADVKSYSDYYPFGMQLPNRKGVEGDSYRYGFNGKEKDDELKGNGNSYDFGARMYDPRIGRWFSRDPLFQYYPDMSEYNYAANNPIYFVDADGRILRDKDGNIIYTKIPGTTETKEWPGKPWIDVTLEQVYIYSDEGEKIKVDLITIAIDVPTKDKILENSKEWQFYNCHGHSSLNKNFLVPSDDGSSNNVLLDKMGEDSGADEPGDLKSLVSTDFTKIKTGDIIVYFDEDGNAIHSARFQGKNASEDKVDSKNGFGDFGTYTQGEVDQVYIDDYGQHTGQKITKGYFTPQADKQIGVEGKVNKNRGIVEVSEADVQKALNP